MKYERLHNSYWFCSQSNNCSWKLLHLQDWVMTCAPIFFLFLFFWFFTFAPWITVKRHNTLQILLPENKGLERTKSPKFFLYSWLFIKKKLVLPQGGFGKTSLLEKGGGEGKTGGGTWKSPPFGCLKYLSAWKLNMMQLMNSNPPPSVLPSLSRDRCADSMAPSLKELSFMEADLSARHEWLQAFGCSMYFKQNHHVSCQISRDNIRD